MATTKVVVSAAITVAHPDGTKLRKKAIAARLRGTGPLCRKTEVTEEQVRRIDDLVREEFEGGEWVTVEAES